MGIAGNNSLGVTASGAPPAGDLANDVFSGVFTAVGPSASFPFQGQANFAIWAANNTPLTVTAGSTAASVVSGTGIVAGASVNSILVPAGTTWATFAGTAGTLAFPPQTYWGKVDSAGIVTGLASTAGLLGATVTRPPGAVRPVLPANTTVLAILSPTSVKLSAAPTTMAVMDVPVSLVFAPTGNAITASGTDANATFTDSTLSWIGTVQVERSFDGGFTFNCCNVGGAGQLAQYTGGPINNSWLEPERGVLYRFNCIAYTSGNINYRMSQNAGPAMSLFTGGVV